VAAGKMGYDVLVILYQLASRLESQTKSWCADDYWSDTAEAVKDDLNLYG
jgi:hypothetical protein